MKKIQWQTKAMCECLSGDCYNKYSKLTFDNGCNSTFEGYLKKGNLIKGKYVWQGGVSTYDGNLKKGIPHGYGKLKQVDGTLIDGNFSEGNVFGKATITHPDGSVERGYFNTGAKLQGKGSYQWTRGQYAGSMYEGDFEQGRFEGFGEMLFNVKDLMRSGKEPDGKDGCIIVWPALGNNDQYIGEWENCNFSGYGVYYSPSTGQIKSGFWKKVSDEDYDVFELPEDTVIQILNKKYNKRYKTRSKEIDETKKGNIDSGDKELEKQIQQKRDTIAFPGEPSIVTKVKTVEEENIYGDVDEFLQIDWELDSSELKFEKGVINDFPSGVYLLEESKNAKALMRAVNNALRKPEIQPYLSSTDLIRVRIFASADQSRPTIRYRGEYGDDISGTFDKAAGDIDEIGEPAIAKNLKKNTYMRDNNTLAYARAYGAKYYMTERIEVLPLEKTKFRMVTKVFSKDKGSEYRRLSVRFSIRRPKKIDNTLGKLKDEVSFSDSIPSGTKTKETVGIIISNFDYTSKNSVATGERDGLLVKDYFRRSLGIDKIYYYDNKTTNNLNNLFKRVIPKLPIEGKNLVIYISSHGSKNENGAPVIQGIDAEFEEGLVVDSIYAAMGRLESRINKSFLIFDCCYTVDGKGDVLDEDQVKPIYTTNKMVCLHATKGSISYTYKEKGYSLFTYGFCKGIYENRNQETLDIKNLYGFLKDYIPQKANEINSVYNQNPYIFPEKVEENASELLEWKIVNYRK
ncbi:MAG: caspase family protein [Bacteroidia bacterium]|nr:caspase family protein [Bacteroidia bacterium]